mmetsp:Transcript_41256/g.97878  ORF Transcript_41256/g.97878 Transcript_41256/m.97878 type:complete len:94 (+) Transcript_41256:1538-1819(+)
MTKHNGNNPEGPANGLQSPVNPSERHLQLPASELLWRSMPTLLVGRRRGIFLRSAQYDVSQENKRHSSDGKLVGHGSKRSREGKAQDRQSNIS